MIKKLDPRPILQNFHRLSPLEHQERFWVLSREMKHYGLFHDMGTGKSKIIIDTIAWLFLTGEIDGAVIISDKGCYMGWHDEEIEKHLSRGIPHRIAYWSSYMPAIDKRRLEELMTPKDDVLDFMCINVEAFSSGQAAKIVERFISMHYCLMCVDEATSIKNHKSERTKQVMRLGRMCDYRRIATGTPITQSPLDLFSMCEFLQPGLLGFRSFVPFRAHFAKMQLVRMGPRAFNKIVGFQRLDELTRRIQPFTSRVLKEEVTDIPEKVYEKVYVEQTPEQEGLYNKFRDEALLQLDQRLLTSTSAITTINKLHQINCGHVKLDDGTVVDIPCERIPQLMDLLEKLSEKVVIWCCFQRDVELILAAIEERFADTDKYAIHYYGKTGEAERRLHLEKFKNDVRCQWMVGTAATGGKGINGLQCVSRYCVYYSNSYDLEDRLQSEDRLHRHGQKWPVTYFDFVCRGTIDTKILDSHKRKEDLSFEVLDKLREMLTT